MSWYEYRITILSVVKHCRHACSVIMKYCISGRHAAQFNTGQRIVILNCDMIAGTEVIKNSFTRWLQEP